MDLDVTPLDNSKTHKEGVAHTYKGFDGYAPMMAYIGTEGFLANTELRKGNQHCQCNTPAFIRQTLRLGHQLADRQLLVRMDAGKVIERTTDKNGQFLLVPDSECNTIWTNLGWSDDAIINGYHAHGECEQFHSEIKTDMDVERLPSGKFDTNELVLELTVLAYNILRLIGQESLKSRRAPKTKHPVKRRRIRTVIGNLIQIAGHITTHGRRIVLAIGCSNVWRHVFMDVYNRFALA